MKKNKLTRALPLVLAFVAVLAADQGLKAWVVNHIPLNSGAAGWVKLIPGVIHMTHIQNRGAAFGMLAGGRWMFLLLLAAFCALVIWALATKKLIRPVERTLAVLAMAGAVGNGIDRALYGYVVDMFEAEFVEFAVFNVADAVINVTCILYVLLILFNREEKKPKQA